ncbi:putative thiamine biosynthesis protein ApbE precursor [Buchnera aphidicola str. LL01 (Acyrthosiphon pisum)]|nr:putative thiamine biosynthesis protein ApbE precursor [Buchnera aphidicola str. LL01 (Acyrthosiphon pisum)]
MWGFGTKEKLTHYPSKKKIKEKIFLSGSQHLKLIKNSFGMFLEKDIDGIEINLSTLGEGFAVDHLSRILTKKNKKLYYLSRRSCISQSRKKYKKR